MTDRDAGRRAGGAWHPGRRRSSPRRRDRRGRAGRPHPGTKADRGALPAARRSGYGQVSGRPGDGRPRRSLPGGPVPARRDRHHHQHRPHRSLTAAAPGPGAMPVLSPASGFRAADHRVGRRGRTDDARGIVWPVACSSRRACSAERTFCSPEHRSSGSALTANRAHVLTARDWAGPGADCRGQSATLCYQRLMARACRPRASSSHRAGIPQRGMSAVRSGVAGRPGSAG